MKMKRVSLLTTVLIVFTASLAVAQISRVEPQVLTIVEGRTAEVYLAPRFATAIRLPEAVNSIVVGDPSAFVAEHSEKEPNMVFAKALVSKAAQSDLFVSTVTGRLVRLLLISRGENASHEPLRIHVLVQYENPAGFLVNPSPVPFASVSQSVSLTSTANAPPDPSPKAKLVDASLGADPQPSDKTRDLLDQLLDQQTRSPLPVLYGQHVGIKSENGDRVRAGVGGVVDGGDTVLVRFSALNPSTHEAVELMPPQVQLAGTSVVGKIHKHSRWSTSQQLPVLDFRLTKRRLGPGERADGVLVFRRPPYKQSNETVFLQIAEAGAVDRPALAPIGFGVSTSIQGDHDGQR